MRTPIPDNSDIIEKRAADYIRRSSGFITNKKFNMSNINWKVVRVMFYFAVVFIVGGLQAIKGSIPGDITSVMAILGIVEHLLEPVSTV